MYNLDQRKILDNFNMAQYDNDPIIMESFGKSIITRFKQMWKLLRVFLMKLFSILV